MDIITLLIAVIALAAITGTLVMMLRDGRGTSPAPRSRATDPDLVPPALRAGYRR